MNDAAERDEPMKGLAELRRIAASMRQNAGQYMIPGYSGAAVARSIERVLAEVEASRQRSAAMASSEFTPFLYVHELLGNGGGIWIGHADRDVVERSHDPGETGEEIIPLYRSVLATPPSERPAAPAQAGVTEAQGCVAHGLAHPCEACAAELPLRDALAVLTELIACVDGDCSTPEKLAYWDKREVAAWDRARSLLAGTPPAQSEGGA